MKHLKLYEEVKNDIKTDDYVVFDTGVDSVLGNFFRTTIGQVRNAGFGNTIPVDYDKVPDNLIDFFNYSFGVYIKFLPIDKVLFSSPNKKDVELFLASNKYNL